MSNAQNKDKQAYDSSLGLSDEDFLNQPLDVDFDFSTPYEDTPPQEEDTPQQEEDQELLNQEDGEKLPEEDNQDYDSEEDEIPSDDEGDDSEVDSQSDDEGEEQPQDYEAMYKAITAPFKANGREYTVDSPEEAITLMQMGANYNKKMAAIKPNLRLLKTLEINQLLDEEKLNYLIDLSKGNPEAISKLISDTEFDAYSVDAEAVENYKPNSHGVSESVVDFDLIVEEIKDTPKFGETATIVSQQWDEESKRVIGENPEYLRWINNHVHNGVYDRIASVVEKERILGKLDGVSDIAAYHMIGDQMDKAGAFNDLVEATQQPKRVEPNTEAKQENARQKRRAVSSPKSVTTAPKKDEYNPLEMSDEEFAKIFSDKFI